MSRAPSVVPLVPDELVASLEASLALSNGVRDEAKKARRARRIRLAVALWRFLRPLTLSFLALGSFVTAAFLVSPILGFCVLGAAFLALEWMGGSTK